MDLRSEIAKTIKRLTIQEKHEILKNKLRFWIVNNEITLNDLLWNCKQNKVQLSCIVLNKLAALYGQGKEGVNLDYTIAFNIYEFSAELGRYIIFNKIIHTVYYGYNL